jgi:hypothetical protein
LGSRIHFTFTGNLAHDYLFSFSQKEKCVRAQMIQKGKTESTKTGTRIERSWC